MLCLLEINQKIATLNKQYIISISIIVPYLATPLCLTHFPFIYLYLGEKQVQPVLLGVTFGPDGRRFCQCRSDFMNDIFGALFLDDFMSGSVMLL